MFLSVASWRIEWLRGQRSSPGGDSSINSLDALRALGQQVRRGSDSRKPQTQRDEIAALETGLTKDCEKPIRSLVSFAADVVSDASKR
jgi:hypothetical protein